MSKPQTSDTGKTDPTDDQGKAPQYDESMQFADGGRSAVISRLCERFLFSG